MHSLYFLLCAAIAPVAAGLGYICIKDKYNKEPVEMLIGAFVLGIASIIPICIIELILMVIGSLIIPENSPFLSSFWSAFIVAAIIEECFKLFFLYIFVWNHPAFDERFDGIVYGVFVSLGFACAENLIYVFGNLLSAGFLSAFTVSITRAFFSIPCHFFCGVILGYYLSIAKFENVNNNSIIAREGVIFKGLCISILFHGFYDFILFYGGSLFNNMNNDSEWGIVSLILCVTFFFVFMDFNILFWRFGYIRIERLSKLLRPNSFDEPSLFITCSNCGQTYASDLISCPNCNQLTEKTIQVQKDLNNDFSRQDLHNLNSFYLDHSIDSMHNFHNDL